MRVHEHVVDLAASLDLGLSDVASAWSKAERTLAIGRLEFRVHWVRPGEALLLAADLRPGDHWIDLTMCLRLRAELPAGLIAPTNSVRELLETVVSSFGRPIGPMGGDLRLIYTGPWRGPPSFAARLGEQHLVHLAVKGGQCRLACCLSITCYLEWYSRWPRVMSPVRYFLAQRQILEDVFGADWFRTGDPKRRNHPAFKRWITCQAGVSRGGILPRYGFEDLPELASTLLDGYLLVQATVGESKDLRLGDLANYGDSAAQAHVRATLKKKSQFWSTLLELSYAAWCRSQGLEVSASSDDGFPDLKIEADSASLPIYADCKRIERASKLSRVEKVVKKASKQVRAVPGSHHGLVVIDVSDRVLVPARCVTPYEENLTILQPAEVAEVCDFVRQEFRPGKRVRLSAALICWRNYLVSEGDRSAGIPGVTILSQRCELVVHPAAAFPVEQELLHKLRFALYFSFNTARHE